MLPCGIRGNRGKVIRAGLCGAEKLRNKCGFRRTLAGCKEMVVSRTLDTVRNSLNMLQLNLET